MKCSISPGSTLFVKGKRSSDKKNTIFLKIINVTPLDFYIGLSQVYCMKPEGRIY